MDELEEFRSLWDGSEDWALSQHHFSQARLKVVFEAGRPSVRELMALRQLCDRFRDVPAQQVKAQIGGLAEVELGTLSSLEARHVAERARQLGLQIVAEDTSHTSYSMLQKVRPEDRLGGEEYLYLLVEDEELARRVVQKMLEAGVPIIEWAEID